MRKTKIPKPSIETKWVFFILTAILLAVYTYKKDINVLKKVFFGPNEEKNEISEKVFQVATEQQVEELDEKIKNLKNEIEKKSIELQQSTEELKKKNLLLGTIMNENFYILKNRGNLKDLIYLNADWTIDRLPKFIQIENREEIEKLLKDNQ